MTVQELYNQAFSRPREPRSPEYRTGVLWALRVRFGKLEKWHCPYDPGTAKADAFLAGTEEGHQLYNQHIATIKPLPEAS